MHVPKKSRTSARMYKPRFRIHLATRHRGKNGKLESQLPDQTKRQQLSREREKERFPDDTKEEDKHRVQGVHFREST